MKLGAFSLLFIDQEFEEVLDYYMQKGLEAIEVGTGAYIPKSHCNVDDLLSDDKKIRQYKEKIKNRGLEISALSCHANMLHPQNNIAKTHYEDFKKSILLAEKLGVEIVVTMSGCPGDSESSLYPNWVTCAWPTEYREIAEWQWNKKVTPFWREQNKFAKEHHVKIAIEPHPGMVVYNTETALRLRKECGNNVGVNLDPSHLFWQGIDPVIAIKEFANVGALFYFHAKDVGYEKQNVARNGVLDYKNFANEAERSWLFRTIGYGHGEEKWKEIISTLIMVGYNGVISIEHEDSLISNKEGFNKAIKFLKGILIREKGKLPAQF